VDKYEDRKDRRLNEVRLLNGWTEEELYGLTLFDQDAHSVSRSIAEISASTIEQDKKSEYQLQLRAALGKIQAAKDRYTASINRRLAEAGADRQVEHSYRMYITSMNQCIDYLSRAEVSLQPAVQQKAVIAAPVAQPAKRFSAVARGPTCDPTRARAMWAAARRLSTCRWRRFRT